MRYLYRPYLKKEHSFLFKYDLYLVRFWTCKFFIYTNNRFVGILSFDETKAFTLEKIKLKTVRPFIIKHLSLANENLNLKEKDIVEEFLEEKILQMINEAKIDWAKNFPEKQESEFPKPLIRLKVFFFFKSGRI
jgi:double-strand break repair protein MRE11